ncbi:RagB/SusD family nutrient uptake outer membrane protein [Flavobacterium sp. F-65]|uniref:RagB/SusD family nutrient uptake outer membrane protein n=1 Tax=Flavobacterium pisciphilum TaxID=2893755 RepID=A0ABS8MRZ7_9FLAO|nr:RagB/SusD family nutrient uptake outer membrane protein [Flavobacterium sp. F-65]MCC9070695.1 RagB/SusD family nutrient uptake outer membrane protein [Flavobacterium sp. F-65]
MKNIKIALSLLLLISISSCDEFLSETPDNRTQIDTPEKISELLVNAYPSGGTYMDFAETMTDNVTDGRLGSTLAKNEQNYNWEMEDETDIDTQAGYWEACYRAIAHANKALEAIEEQGFPANMNAQRGEALLARAYSHFMLVSFWSNRYNPATAATDLGIPYVTEPETVLIKKYTRNTVEEVFNYIQKDLEEGLKYVTNEYKEPKFHFNKEAGKAFASRFYLIKGDWAKVLEVTEGIGSKPVGKIRDYLALTSLDPNIQFIDYARAEHPTNLLIVSSYSIYSRANQLSRFYFGGNKVAEVMGNATNIYNKAWYYSVYSYNSKTNFVPKFKEYFKYTNLTANIGEPFLGTVLLSNDEFYLNRIEALVMSNRIAEANTELEFFLGTRTAGYNAATDKLTEAKIVAKYPVIADEYTPFYAMTPVQTSYIKAIAETKRRDFLHEGIRWFDVKRFNIEVKHEIFNRPTNILVKNDKRRALQIPLSASSNGVEKNPR